MEEWNSEVGSFLVASSVPRFHNVPSFPIANASLKTDASQSVLEALSRILASRILVFRWAIVTHRIHFRRFHLFRQLGRFPTASPQPDQHGLRVHHQAEKRGNENQGEDRGDKQASENDRHRRPR